MGKRRMHKRVTDLLGKTPPTKPVQWQVNETYLLTGSIPLPMHGTNPRTILGRAWWDKTRRESYESTEFHCIACGVHKYNATERDWLEGHEEYQIDYLMGRMQYVQTVPLCYYCHMFTHPGRLNVLLEKGSIARVKYDMIMAHGRSVLARANLRPIDEYRGPQADWGDWRLVLFGKEYPPRYKSFDEWRRASEEID